MRKTLTDHEVFWLARHAHNTLGPLFEDLKEIEPSATFAIQMEFQNAEAVFEEGYVNVYIHWKREGMFLYATRNQTAGEISELHDQMLADIEKLRAEA